MACDNTRDLLLTLGLEDDKEEVEVVVAVIGADDEEEEASAIALLCNSASACAVLINRFIDGFFSILSASRITIFASSRSLSMAMAPSSDRIYSISCCNTACCCCIDG